MSGARREGFLPPQLASAVAAADEAELRAMTEVGCRLAVARTGVEHPAVDAGTKQHSGIAAAEWRRQAKAAAAVRFMRGRSRVRTRAAPGAR